MTESVDVSVVVPVKDEAENVGPLALEIVSALRGGTGSEIVFVDDGSSDGTVDALLKLKGEVPNLRVISHQGNFGQSRAIRTGVRAASGHDRGDARRRRPERPGRYPRSCSPRSARRRRNRPWCRACGMKRRDTLAKRLASRLANRFRGWMLGDHATDTGCGLKAFRRDAYLELPYFDHMHRYFDRADAARGLRRGFRQRAPPPAPAWAIEIRRDRSRARRGRRYPRRDVAEETVARHPRAQGAVSAMIQQGDRLADRRPHLADGGICRPGAVRLALHRAVVQERDRGAQRHPAGVLVFQRRRRDRSARLRRSTSSIPCSSPARPRDCSCTDAICI